MGKLWETFGKGASAAGRGIGSGAKKGWQTYSDHRVKVAEARAAESGNQGATTDGDLARLVDLESEALDFSDRVKLVFGQVVGLVAPFILAVILALSNGYLFAGLRDLDGSLPVRLAYAAGFTLEAIGLAAVYSASYNLKYGYRFWTMMSFLGVAAMAFISLLSQYAYLEVDKAITLPSGAIEHMPLINALIGRTGLGGNDLFFMVRAIAYHVGEILCAFIISKRGKSLRKLLAQQREIAQSRNEMQQQALFLDFQRIYADGFKSFMQGKMPERIAIAELQVGDEPDDLDHLLESRNGNGRSSAKKK